ncbi:MAG: NifB/NifX family molybdenum-iron cluster-binding protein [Polyangia bacterium]
MKIAVTSTGPNLDDAVEMRFGRCPYFLIVETESMEFEAVQNPNVAAGGGAGIQSAQMMADKEVSAVLTGNCGPNAFRTFEAAGIQVITGAGGSVREAVEAFEAGGRAGDEGPNVQSHFGMGGGGGTGRGGGGGMGRGGGGGMGRGGGGGGRS